MRLFRFVSLAIFLLAQRVVATNGLFERAIQNDVQESIVENESQLQEKVSLLNDDEALFVDNERIRLTKTLTVSKNNIVIRGRGTQTTTIECGDFKGPALIIEGNNVSVKEVTFSGCTRESAVVVEGNAQSSLKKKDVSFYAVRFLKNGEGKKISSGGGLKLGTCSEGECVKLDVRIQGCKFEKNKAVVGGSIFANHSIVNIEDSVFVENAATVAGGAVFVTGANSHLLTDSCKFERNIAGNKVHSEGNQMSQSVNKDEITDRRSVGGAVFVNTTKQVTIKGSKFLQNSACTAGGAICLIARSTSETTPTAVDVQIKDSHFKRNSIYCIEEGTSGPTDVFQELFHGGGAIFSHAEESITGDVVVQRSSFLENEATEGGAVEMESAPEIRYLFKSCNFTRNHANYTGGALLARKTTLTVKGTLFWKNRGIIGGGIFAGPDVKMVAGPDKYGNNTVLDSNIALYGGGCEATIRVAVTLEGVVFRNNTAVRFAGAMRVVNSMRPIIMRGVLFEQNEAMIGGALSFTFLANVTLESFNGRRTVFSNNKAVLGGALEYNHGEFLFLRAHIEDTDFINNSAYSLNESDFESKVKEMYDDSEFMPIIKVLRRSYPKDLSVAVIFADVTSLPDGHGGGFWMRLGDPPRFTIAQVVLKNVMMSGNQAKVGGGAHIDISKGYWNRGDKVDCFPAIYGVDSCQNMVFQNVTITENRAIYAGGLFVTDPSSVMVTCDRSDPESKSTLVDGLESNLASEESALNVQIDAQCTKIHSNSISDDEYKSGANIGSNAYSLHVANPTAPLAVVPSGEEIAYPCLLDECSHNRSYLTLFVKDAFNQTIHRGIADAELELTVQSNHVIGVVRYAAVNGTAVLNGTKAWGINISSTLTIFSTFQRSINVDVNFSTRACSVGEYVVDTLCKECPTDQYSFNSSEGACIACEEYAACKGGAVLIPIDAYWHSSPFSPQFHNCLINQACKYPRRAENLTAFHKNISMLESGLENLTLYLSDGGDKPLFIDYQQCSDGYEGILCGSCDAGYGHSANGECVKCTVTATRAVVFLILQLVWMTILITANAIVILGSSTTRIQLAYYRREAQPRTRAMRGIARTRQHVTEREAAASRLQNDIVEGLLASTDETKLRLMDQKLNASIHLSETIKIMVSYLQIVSMAINIPVAWDRLLDGFLNMESSTSNPSMDGILTNCECMADALGFHHPSTIVLWMKMLTPAVVVCIVLAAFTCAWRYLNSTIRRTNEEALNKMVSKSWNVGATVIIVSSIFLSFVDITQGFLKAINCVDVDEELDPPNAHGYGKYSIEMDNQVWVEDTDYTCFHGKHRFIAFAGIAGLIFSVVVIILTLLWIPLNRGKTHEVQFIVRYSFLYQGYKEEWYTAPWEAMILLRKAVLVAVVVFSYRLGPGLQSSLAIGILLIALALQNAFVPFKVVPSHRPVPLYFRKCFGRYAYSRAVAGFLHICNVLTMNALEASSLFCSIAVFFTALIVNDEKASLTAKDTLAVFVFLINAVFILFLLLRIYAGVHAYLDYELKHSDPKYEPGQEESPGIISLGRKLFRFVWLICRNHVTEFLKYVSNIPRIDLNPGLQSFLRSRGDFRQNDSDSDMTSPSVV